MMLAYGAPRLRRNWAVRPAFASISDPDRDAKSHHSHLWSDWLNSAMTTKLDRILNMTSRWCRSLPVTLHRYARSDGVAADRMASLLKKTFELALQPKPKTKAPLTFEMLSWIEPGKHKGR